MGTTSSGGTAAPWKGVRGALAALSLAVIAACGGAGGSSNEPVAAAPEMPASRMAAARFLTQASFGPTDATIDRVMAVGYAAWIDEQLAKPATSHLATWDAADAAVKAVNAANTVAQDGVINSFWKQALTGEDQLRQRVAYALSQIVVISMQDNNVGENPRAVAAWLDMLGDKGLGNYRDLLETASRHPLMGAYLTSLRNQKADAKSGRVPDENYAREVMQLFSIGLVELNEDGSARTDANGTIDTYGPTDIAGLAKVFTGWSWDCPDQGDNNCFFSAGVGGNVYTDRWMRPMYGYPQYHSKDEKSFLGTTIPAQAASDPNASLAAAMDALFNHPNVGPFIGRQLIQRLVTSNPSADHVRSVARAFADNGKGVRGDMKAVVKAVLMHPDARLVGSTTGKLREPVLRLSALLRAFDFKSDTGGVLVGNTDDPGTRLAQTPLRSPTVFNFYRPGYAAPGTAAAAAGLVSPEFQLAQETTAAGYVNYMRDAVGSGVGAYNVTVNGVTLNRRDLQSAFVAEMALADNPAELVDRMNERLMYGSMPDALKSEIQGAVASIVIPALNAAGTNQPTIDLVKRQRVNAAIFLTLVSPEFQVQK